MVAERSAEQQQRGQRQEIGVDDPLHLLRPGAVALADRGQGDAEDRAFDEGQARREDAGDERPALVAVRNLDRAVSVARAQSTRSAIAASTMLRHTSGSPAAAMSSSGSRIVCSTASAWFTCSRHACRPCRPPRDRCLPHCC